MEIAVSSARVLTPHVNVGSVSSLQASSRRTVRRWPVLVLLLGSATLGMLMSLLFMASDCEPARMMDTMHGLFTWLSPRRLIIGGSVIAALGVSLGGIFIGLACAIVHILIRPQKRTPFIPLIPSMLDMPAEEITFPSLHGEHQVRGIYLAQQDATTTILVSPGYRRTVLDVLGVCKQLWAAGHTVLAFEYYGHGTPVGKSITLGYREINDFLGAVSYARRRAPHTLIGALGYSMGGAVSIMGSAHTPEVRAVVADSAFASHWSAVELAIRRTFHLPPNSFALAMSLLRRMADVILAWRAGYHFHQVEPWRDIARLAPRPVLLIHGLHDRIVDPHDSVQLYEAAGSPRALWHLPGEHVRAYFADPQTYATRIIAFFDRHLKQSVLTTPPPLPSQAHTGVEIQREQASSHPSFFEEKQMARPFWQEASRSPISSRQSAFSRLGFAYGHLIYRFRRAILIAWAILVLGSLPFAGAVSTALQNSGYSVSGSESQEVDMLLTTKLHQPATSIQAVFHSSGTPVSDPAYQRELRTFMAQAKRFAHVISVVQEGVGKDGTSALIVIGFNQEKDTIAQEIPVFRTLLPPARSGPALVSLTGDAVVANEMQLDTQSDTETAELIALPLTLLVLLIVFGSLVAGLMPLIMAAVTVPGSLAIIYLLAFHRETNIFIQSLVSIIGLGLSIDYSLVLIRRFREELDQGCAIPLAVARTVATAGEAILLSAATVAIGFAGLLLIAIQVVVSFGLGGMIVASLAALAALTLLPALLSVLGDRINALPVPGLRRLSQVQRRKRTFPGKQPASTIWHTWALFVMKRPLRILLHVLAILLVLSWPALSLNPGLPGVSSLPAQSQARRGWEIMAAQFPTINTDPLLVVVQTTNGSSILTSSNMNRIAALTQWIARQQHVSAVTSLTSPPVVPGVPALSEGQVLQLYRNGSYQQMPALRQFVASVTNGDTTLITVRASTIAGSRDDETLIDQLRSVNPVVRQGLLIRVGGARAIDLDFDRVLYRDFFHALIFLVLATSVLLLFAFRSILLPLKAILMNVLSIGGAYGALVFVFQQGHGASLLGFTASGFLDRFIPILLFCVLFGLSMDYEVFLLSRIREEWQQTGNNRAAVARGLEKTGGVITSAALLFLIVSGSFVFTRLIVTKELGFGITVAVLIDATLIRLLLVPATMQLLGTWNWWFPGRTGISHLAEEVASRWTRLHSALVARSILRVNHPALPPQTAVEQTLRRLMAQLFAIPQEQFHSTSDFFAYGGDSHTLAAFLSLIAQHFQVRIEADDVFLQPLLHQLAARIIQKQEEARFSPPNDT